MSRFVTSNTFNASGTISTAVFLKYDPANPRQVLQCGLGDAPTAGIGEITPDTAPIAGGAALVAAIAGEGVESYAFGSTVPLTAGTGGWTTGDYLKPDANGAGITALPGDVAGAIAVSSASAGDTPEVVSIPPTIVPAANAGAFLVVPGSLALTKAHAGLNLLLTGSDAVVTLPPVATSKGFRFRATTAGAAAVITASTTGTQVILNAADATVKMFGTVITTPAANKGLTNTKSTAIQGDTASFFCDGTQWWVDSAVSGTWVRQA